MLCRERSWTAPLGSIRGRGKLLAARFTNAEEQAIAEALTTAAIERKTGVSRSTLYFYIRQGLIPEPQKTAGGRSLYSQDHVDLIHRIGELKREGLSLADIKRALDPHVAKARDSSVDLPALESERMHFAIIKTAIDEFMAKGYKQTHVSTIIQKLGINPQLFYSHFPSKLQLLSECFTTFIERTNDSLEPGMVVYEDIAERNVRRVAADRRGHELGSMLAAAIRSEGSPDDLDHYRLANSLGTITSRVAEEIGRARPADAPPPSVSDEMLAYGLLGALNYQSLRASWGDGVGTADFLRAHLFVHLAITAAVAGEIDIYGKLARYEELIQEVSAQPPKVSPAFDD
jgi:DNA-binding transcriptional MerR regulator